MCIIFSDIRTLILDNTRHEFVIMNTRSGPWVAYWLPHRAPDRKAYLCSMPVLPNTLRVHTEYVLVKSVGPKVLWAESRVQGTGENFPPCQFHA
ncbi:hypothetical protein TNCV_3194021 [Trichonephila clavipes]|uniref:Uncharacterized protein n=1 Tax=Trichonephila clavipes TaxID=2585209 RepID=A0A8X6V2B3_TRICX|nr:hypothetical protein TNCV_3194021 [Trichonephila clavipes]